jgi:hypothetical protein
MRNPLSNPLPLTLHAAASFGLAVWGVFALSLTLPPSGSQSGVYPHCHRILQAHDSFILFKGYC